MKLYLAGPMTGYENNNHAAFDHATTALRAFGYEVFSPAEYAREHYTDEQLANFTPEMRRAVLADDYAWITANAEGIALLPDWQSSSGAQSEVAIGQAINVPIKKWQEWIFEEAALTHYIDGLIANAIGFGSVCFVESRDPDCSKGHEFDSALAAQGVAEYRESLFRAVITPLLDEVRGWR